MTLRSPQFTTALQSLYRCIGPQAHLGATHYATAAIEIGAGVSNPAHTAPSNRFYKSVGIRQVEGKVGLAHIRAGTKGRPFAPVQ